CPSCNVGNDFDILESLIASPLYVDGNVQMGGPTIPLIGLVCKHCFNIRFFSAVMMGIAKPLKPESKR
ncbi:MAG TPA: hypothetical protein VG097_06190, partial [Gemmata sp.]|nr:hypothetical protein [Gemmata sp.]